jgi:hypothetical protein
MKKYIKIITILLYFFCSFSITGQDLLTESSAIKPLNDIKLVDSESLTVLQTKVYENLKDLKPNFLTQLDFEISVPLGKEDEFLSKVISILTDFSHYNEIPYYSRQNDSWHQLFYDIELSHTFNNEWIETLNLRMQPFEPGKMQFSMESGRDGILFNSINIDHLYYGKIRAARSEKMKISLSVEKAPGKLIFYGLGGAKAFGGFGSLRDRLDVAFNGRIEAFFLWIDNSFNEVLLEN